MVTINPSGISRKLKMKKTEKLIKKIFDDSVEITTSLLENIFVKVVKEEDPQDSKYILIISLSKNVFALADRTYFNKTEKLANEYERLFGTEKNNEKGGEGVIKTNYGLTV